MDNAVILLYYYLESEVYAVLNAGRTNNALEEIKKG